MGDAWQRLRAKEMRNVAVTVVHRKFNIVKECIELFLFVFEEEHWKQVEISKETE